MKKKKKNWIQNLVGIVLENQWHTDAISCHLTYPKRLAGSTLTFTTMNKRPVKVVQSFIPLTDLLDRIC